MAQASESQASGPIFGELEAAFGSRKPPKVVYKDKAQRQYEEDLTAALGNALGQLPSYIRGFDRSLSRITPRLGQATRESDAALSGILRQQSPMENIQQLGDYAFNRVQQVPDSVLNYLANAQNLSNTARGLSPGADSSYERILRGGLATKAALEGNRAVFGFLGNAFPQLQTAIQNQNAGLLNVLPARTAGWQALAGLPMLPYQALLGGLRDHQGLGITQNLLREGNIQGYQPQENWANRLGAVGRAATTNVNQIMDWAQQAASIYGGLMGAGGGGGGMGGMGGLFGGGGNQAAPSTYYTPSMVNTGANMLSANQTPYGTTYNPYSDTSNFYWGS